MATTMAVESNRDGAAWKTTERENNNRNEKRQPQRAPVRRQNRVKLNRGEE